MGITPPELNAKKYDYFFSSFNWKGKWRGVSQRWRGALNEFSNFFPNWIAEMNWCRETQSSVSPNRVLERFRQILSMETQVLVLLVLVIIPGTFGITRTANYRSVFVPNDDVVVLSNNMAKSVTECTSLYQKKAESVFSFFLHGKENGTCLTGEVKFNGSVIKMKTNSEMIKIIGRHKLLLGEYSQHGCFAC